MTMNGKRDGFTMEDFRAFAKSSLMKRGRAETIIGEVQEAVARWPSFAAHAGIGEEWTEKIQKSLRLTFLSK